jgi:RecA-family ATPase
MNAVNIGNKNKKKELIPEAAKTEAPKKRQLPPIQTAAEMSEKPAEQRPEIIKGLLKQCSKLAIGGASKARKTWLLIHLAVAAASGYDWFNFKVPNKVKVLYVNFELHNDTFEKRLDLVCEALEMRSHQLGDWFSHWGLRGYAADYNEILPMITEAIKDKGYQMVIIDPMYKILGNTDENKAGDVTRLMNELERVAFDAKVSVVTSNHYSKGNKANTQDGDRISGSGVFQRDPDSLLEFVDQEESKDDNNILSVKARLREHKPMTPFCVEWDNQAIFNVSHHNPGALKKAKPKAKFDGCNIMSVFKDGNTGGEWKEAAIQAFGMSGSTFDRRLKPLVDEVVEKRGEQFYRLNVAE